LFVARYAPGESGFIEMRLYDPRFLLVIGMSQAMRRSADESPEKYGANLAVLTMLMKSTVIDDGATHGLNKAIEAAERVLDFAKVALQDKGQTFRNDPAAFDAWKKIFNPLLEHFDSALTLDIENLYIYVLEKKRGYAPDVLLNHIEEVLPADDRGGLSEFARDNMQESGACLAFHRYTGCGYHMARAVEDVARRYYELVKGQLQKITLKSGDLRDRTLAQIAGEFEDILENWKGSDDPGLLGLVTPTIRQFCRIYRDPLAHADLELKELSPNEAEVAFGHGVSAISTMLEDARLGGPHFAGLLSWVTGFC
jgi:hypothetical protein